MSVNLIFCSGIFSIFIIILILYLIKKEKVNIKYSLIWFLLFFGLLICLFAPGLLDYITSILGFQTASNMVLSLLIAVLVIININGMVINSHQDKKIRLLIQEVSMLKESREKNGKK